MIGVDRGSFFIEKKTPNEECSHPQNWKAMVADWKDHWVPADECRVTHSMMH